MKTLMVIPGPGWKKRPSRLRRVAGFVLAIAVFYVAFFALSAMRRHYPLAAPKPGEACGCTDLRGAWHVHSSRSDGRASPDEIAEAAYDAGLQFVVLADHNVDPEPPRFVHGVLLIDAVEVSTPNGHVVALGVPRALTAEERKGDVLTTIASLGGFAFLAHPEQKKNPWRDWPNAPKATGLELYSADSMFRTAQRSPISTFVPAAAAWLTNPTHGMMTVVTDQPELRERTLRLADRAPYVALCAHDAHGIPGYASEFRTLAMQIDPPAGEKTLPTDPAAAAQHVIGELTHGRAFCSFRAIANGDGFAVKGVDAATHSAHVGDTLALELPTDVPPEIQIRVSGAGKLGADGRSITLEREGAAQIEVWAKVPGMYFQDGWKPWLVASPIRVVSAAAAPPPSAPQANAPAAAPDAGTVSATEAP